MLTCGAEVKDMRRDVELDPYLDRPLVIAEHKCLLFVVFLRPRICQHLHETALGKAIFELDF